MEAMNTINAMEQGKVTFVIDDAQSGGADVEHSTLTEALAEHFDYVTEHIADELEYAQPERNQYGNVDSGDYIEEYLSTWQVLKMVDGEEVATYHYQQNCDTDGFTARELKAIEQMHDDAAKVIERKVQRTYFPSELEDEEREALPIFSVVYEDGSGDDDRECEASGLTYIEAMNFINANTDLAFMYADKGGSYVYITYEEVGKEMEEKYFHLSEIVNLEEE